MCRMSCAVARAQDDEGGNDDDESSESSSTSWKENDRSDVRAIRVPESKGFFMGVRAAVAARKNDSLPGQVRRQADWRELLSSPDGGPRLKNGMLALNANTHAHASVHTCHASVLVLSTVLTDQLVLT